MSITQWARPTKCDAALGYHEAVLAARQRGE